MCEARHARGAQRGGASWGLPQQKSWCAQVRPSRAGVHSVLPLGGGEGHLQTTTARRPDMARVATSSRLGARHGGRPNSAGCASGDTSNKNQRVWGREDGSAHRGSTVESSPTCCRGPTTARKVFMASRSRLAPPPPRRRPGAAPSNGSWRAVDEAPLSPASSSPLVLPHTLPLFPSCGGKQGRGKTPMRCGRWERLGPRVVGAVKRSQGQGARRALVGWRGGFPDVAAQQWLETSL
jgi:hypothetical protein